jgi:hypothetical protein
LSADFDWDALMAKRMRAFWVPPVKDAFDASNFDPAEDDHEPVAYSDDGSNWDADF